MKKVIILYKEMDMGGIESSLMHFILKMKNYADLKLVTWMKGSRDSEVTIPHDIFDEHLSDVFYVDKITKRNVNKHGLKTRLQWLFHKALMKFGKYNNYMLKKIRKVNKNYTADVCICYAPWETSLNIFAEKINCKYSVCLIHGDARSVDLSNIEQLLDKFDKILCVSESCAKALKEARPKLASKVDYVYNFQDVDRIINGAEEFNIEYDKTSLNLVSVSRISEEKGHVRTLKVLKRLKEEGYSFCWNIVGDGSEYSKVEDMIKKYNLQDYCKLYGMKKNPYPYIKNADLFYLGSYHEAAPMVFAESMLLGVPVLTTETCSAKELVGDMGFVCENSEEGIYQAIKYVLDNKAELNKKTDNLKNYSFNNNWIEEKFKKVLKLNDEA